MALSFLLLIVLGVPIMSSLIWVIRWGGPHFYFYVWIFVMCVSLFFITIYPHFIAPLFNTFTELPQGTLRFAIEELAGRLNFPLTRLYVVDGSKRSGHSNAYFYGFFKNKRIVLFDTLLDQVDEQETLAILAHELGHWKHNHVSINFAISSVTIFIQFFLFGQVINSGDIYTSFGFDTRAVLIGLFVFAQIFSPVSYILNICMTFFSRHCEFQADAFAVGLGFSQPLSSGLVKIHTENLGNMNPDPLYSAYHFSHPPLIERLRAISIAHKKE
eukprot:GILI01009361.1.p1 GENE.GILI01009361.1~~GILI01009361.1.p1  ORF type:complete len:272 (-),score=93.51 GILI01009361.1:240-1055(-)